MVAVLVVVVVVVVAVVVVVVVVVVAVVVMRGRGAEQGGCSHCASPISSVLTLISSDSASTMHPTINSHAPARPIGHGCDECLRPTLASSAVTPPTQRLAGGWLGGTVGRGRP